jgi:hypothetical protein
MLLFKNFLKTFSDFLKTSEKVLKVLNNNWTLNKKSLKFKNF